MLVMVFMCAITAIAATKAEADALYEKENYAEAAKVYQMVTKANGVSYEVYYNLGNCYYNLDDIPQAVLYYERAYLLNPGDADVRANLALARGKTVDKVVPPSEMFFVTWWRELTHCMDVTSWTALGLTSFIFMLVGVTLYMFMSQLWLRKIGVYGAMFLFVLLIVANMAAFSQHRDMVNRNTAIIMTPAVAVKSSPSDRSTDLFVIHEGSKVEIIDKSMSDWIEVKFEEGKQGWIPVSAAEVI